MRGKLLSSGSIAYFWAPPTWAIQRGCTVGAEALGTDYSKAKDRCDKVLNPQFTGWRTGSLVGATADRPAVGTFDWMVSIYKSHPKYTGRPKVTRKNYDAALALVSKHVLKDGRTFGNLSLSSISPGAVDRLHEKLMAKPGGGERGRTADGAMRICRRAWNVAWRDKHDEMPGINPFAKMDLSHQAKPTRPVTHAELTRFVKATDDAGEPSIGTAAMIAFFWLQRQTDIIGRLLWNHYRPADNPDIVHIFHHKTRELIALPLVDDDGTELWPELTARLDATAKNGTLIVTRDKPDARRKVHLPWTDSYFQHRVAAIRADAGIDSGVKFMGLRHGGNTEGADAELSDAQLRALSGHKTPSMTMLYAKTTMKQRKVGARKRLESRTKTGGMSE